MPLFRLAPFVGLALLFAHPAIALTTTGCGEEACPCIDIDNCGPPPPPPALAPPVAIQGAGYALDVVPEEFNDGVHQVLVGGRPENYVIQTPQSLGYPMASGSFRGNFAVGVVLAPTVSVYAAVANGGAGATLLYSVEIHAHDSAAADALTALLPVSGAIASLRGYSNLSAYDQTDAASTITTGDGIFSNGEYYAPDAFYGQTGQTQGADDWLLMARASFDCDRVASGPDHYNHGTAGCGVQDFELPINFVSATKYVGGSALDFIGNVELSAGALSFTGAFAESFLDPTISFARAIDPSLYTLTVGGGAVAGGPSAAPEPSSWALMLIATGGFGAALRRRKAELRMG